jgi:hypothetical protein
VLNTIPYRTEYVMQNTSAQTAQRPTPANLVRGRAEQVVRTKKAAEVLKLQTIAEVRQVVYTSGEGS